MNTNSSVGEQFTEIYLKKDSNVQVNRQIELLFFLSQFSFLSWPNQPFDESIYMI